MYELQRESGGGIRRPKVATVGKWRFSYRFRDRLPLNIPEIRNSVYIRISPYTSLQSSLCNLLYATVSLQPSLYVVIQRPEEPTVALTSVVDPVALVPPVAPMAPVAPVAYEVGDAAAYEGVAPVAPEGPNRRANSSKRRFRASSPVRRSQRRVRRRI